MVEAKNSHLIEETKEERKIDRNYMGEDVLAAQDDFFYKISQTADNQFKVEVPSTKKKYLV